MLKYLTMLRMQQNRGLAWPTGGIHTKDARKRFIASFLRHPDEQWQRTT